MVLALGHPRTAGTARRVDARVGEDPRTRGHESPHSGAKTPRACSGIRAIQGRERVLPSERCGAASASMTSRRRRRPSPFSSTSPRTRGVAEKHAASVVPAPPPTRQRAQRTRPGTHSTLTSSRPRRCPGTEGDASALRICPTWRFLRYRSTSGALAPPPAGAWLVMSARRTADTPNTEPSARGDVMERAESESVTGASG